MEEVWETELQSRRRSPGDGNADIVAVDLDFNDFFVFK